MEKYLEELNEQQRAAVTYCDGPQLVVAGAGSGKTRVLTSKIMYLIEHEGIEPYRIMALTFTNKAAREMQERIARLIGEDRANQLWMGTFHSIFSRIIRFNAERLGYQHDYTIYDSADSRALIKLIVKDMELDDKVYKPAMVQSIISRAKNALILPDDYAANRQMIEQDEKNGHPAISAIYSAYFQRCRVAGAMDFDDLLVYANILFRDHPDVLRDYQERFQYVLVDEYQDTNFAQYLILIKLGQLHKRLCLVGDDAQSIYSFRGANIDNIFNIKSEYPELKQFKLERNYRSTKNIINAANSLIDKNQRQIRKHLFSENPDGRRIKVIACSSDYEEAYVVANQLMSMKSRQGDRYSDFAILYRVNAQSRVLEEAFSGGGLRNKHGNVRGAIPYRIYGGLSFYDRKEIKDTVAYMRLAINPNDDEALRRIINYPARGIGDVTVGKLTHCAMSNQVSVWQVLGNPDHYGLTVHSGLRNKLQSFKALIDDFIAKNRHGMNAADLSRYIIDKAQLMQVLLGDKTPENISRQENLSELINGVSTFVQLRLEQGEDDVSLTAFLAEVSLLTDQDRDKNDGDCVTMMTVHSAKGLEFKNVFIVGVEKDLFPAALNSDTLRGIEEERRLLYVAITRAEENCVISYAKSRYINGMSKTSTISPFLLDIDQNLLDMPLQKYDMPKSIQRTPERTFPATASILPRQHTAPRRLTPLADARRERPVTAAARGTGGFTVHNADELAVGTEIMHSQFGHGVITELDGSGADEKMHVRFDEIGERTLLLKFARIKILN